MASYLAAAVSIGPRSHRFAWAVRGAPISERSDPVVAAILVPAMRDAAGLHVPGGASAGLLANLPDIQGLLADWD